MPFYPAYGGLQKSHIKVCHFTRLFSMSFYPTYGGLVETFSCSRCEMPTDKSYTVLDRHNMLKPSKTLNCSVSAGTFVVAPLFVKSNYIREYKIRKSLMTYTRYRS